MGQSLETLKGYMGQLHPQSLLGIGFILTLARLVSENRRAFPFRTVIAGMSALEPRRRDVVVPLVMRSLLAGTMASGLTGSVIGLLPVA